MASCANRPSYKEETIELTIEKWVFTYGQKNPNFWGVQFYVRFRAPFLAMAK